MSIEVIHYDSADEAIAFLEKLALKERSFLFRGHTEENYKLTTTLSRHSSRPHESWDSTIDEMIDSFRVGLSKLNMLPFESEDRQDWLEYARHHGVPTPALDLSYSPYVALFFAFNSVRKNYKAEKPEYSAVYAINIEKLAWLWGELHYEKHAEYEKVMALRQEFLYPQGAVFENGFPGSKLQFIPFPGKYNSRMHRQQGALLYDTLNYEHLGVESLDELIEKHKECDTTLADGTVEASPPTVYKICINKICVSDVFSRLELMGINGGSLYMNADGVAQDVINSYSYNAKTSYLRGVQLPYPDDTKI